LRQSPGPALAVLEGLLLGETAPRSDERRSIEQPALIVGHPNDPLHPFSDAGMLARELPNAQRIDASSILEWRTNPGRLNAELASFLDEIWSLVDEQRRPERKARMAGGGT
jgi:pimeloyl-ACP methyl ester carboxylesterase